MNSRRTIALLILITAIAAPSLFARSFTSSFADLTQCKFSSTGNNPYFPLIPGSKSVFEGKEGRENVKLIITVTNKTKVIGGIETRLVKEHETHNGELVEISFNYFATCKKDNSVFYFGEHTNEYENGVIVSHEGSWQHGENGAQAGLIMPGIVLVGARFQQEVAPDVAMDRAEILTTTGSVSTPAGIFDNAVRTREDTPLEKNSAEFKWYAPNIGLVQDDTLKLTSYSIP
jgi:hypothetical protein